jgi:hypothetical protein
LSAALDDVLAWHEVLRTVFADGTDGPVQVIRDCAEARRVLQFAEVAPAELDGVLAAAANAVIDIQSELPLRATLYTVGRDDHVLLLVVHHIAIDGLAVAPLWRDLARAYDERRQGRVPTRSRSAQYADYALWQQQLAATETEPGGLLARQADYWPVMSST